MHLAELARSARLFLVAVVGLRHFGDGLAVGDSRRDVLDLHLVIGGQARFEDVEVMLALALYDRLFQLLGISDQNRRVFVLGVVEQFAQLLLVGLDLGLYGGAVTRFGEYDRGDRHGCGGCRERVVGARAFQLDRAADVAGRQFGHFDAVFARHGEELRHLLLVARAGVEQLHAFGEFAADHAQVADLADVGFDLALEDERHGRLRLVGGDLLPLGREEFGRFERPRSDVDDELHEAFRSDVALAAGAEQRHDFTPRETDFESRTDVVLRERPLFEIELHERLVVLGGHLHQFAVQLRGALHLLGRNIELLARAVLVFEAVEFHHQHVDEGVEARPLVDGVLHDDGFHARCGADALDRPLEVGLLGVELVDDADERFRQFARIARLNLRTDFPAVLGVEDHYSHVAHLEGREEAAAEVVRSRTVDDVELAFHELREEDRGVDRAFVFVFDVGVVRQRIVRFDGAPAVDDLPLVGHCFGEGGFSGAGGADQDDVLDLFR